MNASSLMTALVQGLQQLHLTLDSSQTDKLLKFLSLLNKWNKVYNLTAVRDPGAMVHRHILDSLSILPFVSGDRVLDVGSGAGLPGIPLAIAGPQRGWLLLDASAKRVRFLRQAVTELSLTQVEPVHQRLEDFQPPQLFHCITARAFADLHGLITGVRHVSAPGARVLAMKGRLSDEELAALPPGARTEQVLSLQVPGLDAQRHLVVIRLDHGE